MNSCREIDTQTVSNHIRPALPKRAIASTLSIVSGLFLLVFVCLTASAQQPAYLQDFGQPSYSNPAPVEYGYVEQANGHLHLEIPIGSPLPQRGTEAPIQFRLAYDSNIWTATSSIAGVYVWEVQPMSVGGGWHLLPDSSGGYGCVLTHSACASDIYLDSNDNTHYFTAFYGNQNSYANDSSGIYDAYTQTDGQAGPAFYAPDGTFLYSTLSDPARSVGPESQLRIALSEDANGNYWNSCTFPPIAGYVYNGPFYCDTTGRNNFGMYNQGAGGNIILATSNSQNTLSNYLLHMAQIQAKTDFAWNSNAGYIPECTGTYCIANVVSEIDLPDGSTFSFQYDCDETIASQASVCNSPGGQTAYYADLTAMTLPTGGTIQYAYTKYNDSYGVPGMWIQSRITPDGTWSYQPQVISTCSINAVGCQQKMTITAPNGSKTVTTSTLDEGSWPAQIVNYDGSGNLYSTTNVSWDFTQPCGFTNCVGNGYIRKLSQSTTIVSSSGTQQTKKTAFSYDSIQHGNISAVKEWGYYPGSSPTFPLVPDRATYTNYYSPANSPVVANGFGGTNIINRPKSVTICNNIGSDTACPGGGGSKVSQTLTGYDVYTLASVPGLQNHDDASYGTALTVRGNPTSISRWISGSNYATTQMSYYMTGQLFQLTDPNLNTTTYNYGDNMYVDNGASPPASYTPSVPTNAYLTQKILPMANGSGPFTETFGYYFGSGKPALSTDFNTKTTYYHFNDPLDRSTSTVYPLGWTLTSYTSHTQTDSYTAITDVSPSTSCASCTHTLVNYDGMGRVSRSEGADASKVYTTYNSMGWVQTVSNPYYSITDTSYGITQYTYDFLGRPSKTTHPDGSSYGLAYDANTITSTDESGNQRLSTYDAFGRLTQIMEPNGVTRTPSLETDYTYDALGNMLTAVQKGVAGTDNSRPTRQFSYDGMSRLVQAFNPEAGTIGYTYDPNGNLSQKTSPAVNVTSGTSTQTIGYCYDSWNRMIYKFYTGTFSCTSPSGYASAFAYDGAVVPGDGSRVPSHIPGHPYNLIGHLTDAQQRSGGTEISTSTPNAFDAMGRIVGEGYGVLSSYSLFDGYGYTYDLAGDLTSVVDNLTNITSSYTYDNARRLNTLTASTPCTIPTCLPAPLYTANSYGPAGIVSATYGNNLNLARYYDNRMRVIDNEVFPSSDTFGWATVQISGTEQAGDSGTVTVTVGGVAMSTHYGATSTPASIAQSLVNVINQTQNTPVQASICTNQSCPTGATWAWIRLDAIMAGTSGDTSVSAISTDAGSSSSSFTATASGTVLTGGSGTLAYYYRLQHSAVGNVKSSVDMYNGNGTYSYDSLNRLTADLKANEQKINGIYYAYQCWGYDSFGNRTFELDNQTAACPSSPPAPSSVSTYSYPVGSSYLWTTYDTNNRITGTTVNAAAGGFTYDLAGNVVNDGVNQYVYDIEGRICAVLNTNTGSKTQYVYDAEGSRIAKGTISGSNAAASFPSAGSGIVPSCIAPTGTGFALSNIYLSDLSGQKEDEFDGQGNWIHTNVYGAAGMTLTFWNPPSGQQLSYNFTDWLGTKRMQANTNPSAEAFWRSDPFGNYLTPISTTADDAEQHFTGKERDAESVNDYFGARYYTSSMGRWMSPDWSEDPVPVPYADMSDPQTLNLYSYADNNPVSNRDSDGHNYQVCDMNGQNCSDLSDDQYRIWLLSNPQLSVTPSGQIWGSNPDGGSYYVGSATYYNEKNTEGAAMIGFGGMAAVKFFVANMISTVAGELGEAAMVASNASKASKVISSISGSRQAIKSGLNALGLSAAQEANVLRAVGRAGNAASMSVEVLGDGSVKVTTSVPSQVGGLARADYVKVIGRDGATIPGSVVQDVTSRSGSTYHYDPKY